MGIFFDQSPALGVLIPLGLALVAALAFEFVNGFHDTSNAVATVIYTRAMRPGPAVAFSGLLNFIGVMAAGVGVAYSVVNLFPAEALVSDQRQVAASLVFAVLASAIFWNLGTWYLGIPASSSHTTIGAIVGASMGYAVHAGLPLDRSLPWDRVRTVMTALLVSPLLGFFLAAAAIMLMRLVVRNRAFYAEPDLEASPPGWIRALLIASCGGVSFSHGSNDGQKGMGLVMVVLICMLPASFSLDLSASPARTAALGLSCQRAAGQISSQPRRLSDYNPVLQDYLNGKIDTAAVSPVLAAALEQTAARLQAPLLDIPADQRAAFRSLCLLESRSMDRWLQSSSDPQVAECRHSLEQFTEYVATWIKLAVALALSLGTMVGWKRIVVTVGEKIGKTHLSYAQGAVAQTVSTTHVLSSGVAGSMWAEKSGLQSRTLAKIATAWVLTLPVCMTLGFGLFLIFLGAT